ncbi:MAG: DUF4173 domain-containing protein [Chloroflexota bacterium]|nr:MAG: DUF4173 domain-containing protein [Chloroflexota bacterium]
MGHKTKLGLGIIGIALVLGIIADSLLRTMPWGLNVALWTGFLALGILLVAHWQNIGLVGGGLWTVLPAILFAGAFAWRDSQTLGLLNFLALLATLTLVALRLRSGQIFAMTITGLVTNALMVGVSALLGTSALVFATIRWQEVPRTGLAGHGLAIARGLAITVPLVIVFGSLFMQADAAFDGLVNRIFQFDLLDLLGHLTLIVALTWCAGGYLWLMLIEHRRADGVTIPIPGFQSLGAVEVSIVLGTLNALFLAFVLVQFRYFFGGAELVEASITLTYAEYARRGFFELVTVAALVLPLLLTMDWLARKENPRHLHIFRLLVALLVGLVFVIIVSAFQRMRLYQAEFGLTELRLYTTAFMIWIAVVFLWFLGTVWRGKRERFVFGMVMAGFLAIALLNWINPDELIVHTNVGRASAERPLDAQYVAVLSADAVPALLEALPSIPEEDRQAIARNIQERWANAANPDWRTWNWGRVQARAASEAKQLLLSDIAATK